MDTNIVCFKDWFKGDGIELNWDYINSIPEFNGLKRCMQTPKWHQEGDAWQHTHRCVDIACEYAKTLTYWSTERRRCLLMAVQLHYIGKINTTEFKKGDWHSYGHEITGERIARGLLWDEPFEDRECVCSLIRFHMERCGLNRTANPLNKILRTSYDVDMDMLYYVMMCDIDGSIPEDKSTIETDKNIVETMSHFSRQGYYATIDSVYGVNQEQLTGNLFAERPLWGDFSELPHIYVMIGLPGAGKDTFIKETFEGDPVVICRDDIRVSLGYCKEGEKIVGTREQEERVTEIFNDRLKQAASEGKTIIINNINLKKKYRDGYKKIVPRNKYRWIYEYIEAPSLSDNIQRREHQIGSDIFYKMILDFDFPRHDEYDELIIQKQNNV